jgi:hypothetical protein
MKRLGKQRVECKQILMALEAGPVKVTEQGIKKTAWYNHPVTQMWRGYEQTLIRYSIVICEEWIERGYNDSLLEYFTKKATRKRRRLPSFLGNEGFHKAHRSNLLRKNPSYYESFGWSEPPDLPYIYPV